MIRNEQFLTIACPLSVQKTSNYKSYKQVEKSSKREYNCHKMLLYTYICFYMKALKKCPDYYPFLHKLPPHPITTPYIALSAPMETIVSFIFVSLMEPNTQCFNHRYSVHVCWKDNISVEPALSPQRSHNAL